MEAVSPIKDKEKIARMKRLLAFNDIVLLQKILNHSSPFVTLRYIGMEQEEINESYNNFSL